MPELRFSSEAIELSDLSTVFRDLGEPLKDPNVDSPADIVVYEIADCVFPTGSICASDGFVLDNHPYTITFEPGSYSVQLIAARYSAGICIAFALMRLSDRQIAKWQLAVTPEQDIHMLKPGEIFGYPVDSGIGCFVDPAAQSTINRLYGIGEPDFMGLVAAEMGKAHERTHSWVKIDTAEGSAVLFTTGYGDGVYGSYFGMDVTGRPIALLSDFGIFGLAANAVN